MRGEPALGLLGRHLGEVPGRRVADADRGGLGLRVGERLAGHQRRRALGLETTHHGQLRGAAEFGVLLVAHPVGGDVAGVADGQQVVVGSVAEEVADLERRGLLALEAHRVDRVDQRDRVVLRQPARDVEAVVEVAADHDDLGAVHDGLGHLAGGDLALGDQHQRLEPGLGGVGRHRGRGVAGRGAHDGLGALVLGHRDGRGHAAVLEGAGRVVGLDLEPHLGAGQPGQPVGVHERSAALTQGDRLEALGEVEEVAVLLDDPRHCEATGRGRLIRLLLRRASPR